ncbi:MAG: hypothetical protein QOD06_2194 [Candidatus Binatota bacterium]|nr:hypothetical protein [Candidatus Binatota bacterium]
MHAGWVMKIVTRTEGGPGPASEQTLSIAHGRIKELHGDGTYYLWDLTQGTLFQVDPAAKSYSGGKIGEMVSSVRKYLEQMRDEIARMTPEERQALADRTRGAPMPVPPGKTPKWTVERTSRTETLLGRRARVYEIRRNGLLHEERWIAGDVPFGDDLDYGAYRRASESLESAFSEGMGNPPPSGPEVEKLATSGLELKKILHGEKVRVVTEVTELDRAEVPESTFTLPVDYMLKDASLPRARHAEESAAL